jgi:hypothetical protein
MLSNTKLSDLAPSGLDQTLQSDFFGEEIAAFPSGLITPLFVELFYFAAICLLTRRQKCRQAILACRTLGK